jgi:hypothetical protein
MHLMHCIHVTNTLVLDECLLHDDVQDCCALYHFSNVRWPTFAVACVQHVCSNTAKRR